MALTNQRIIGRVTGNHLIIRRRPVTMPTGRTFQLAWLSVKVHETDTDAAALAQKEITPSEEAAGQIDDIGSSGEGELRFILAPADTAAIGTKERFYEVKVKYDNDFLETLEQGKILLERGIIEATD